jgi:hypothetical protein
VGTNKQNETKRSSIRPLKKREAGGQKPKNKLTVLKKGHYCRMMTVAAIATRLCASSTNSSLLALALLDRFASLPDCFFDFYIHNHLLIFFEYTCPTFDDGADESTRDLR